MPKITLADHVKECEYRYNEINRRLDSLEHKVDGITHLIESVKTQIITLAIRSTIGILVLVCSAVLVIKH